jgi:hypothetical protein
MTGVKVVKWELNYGSESLSFLKTGGFWGVFSWKNCFLTAPHFGQYLSFNTD